MNWTPTITNYEGNSGSSTYYEDDGYIPNHFIIKDGELKPKRCPRCSRVELMNQPDYSLRERND